MDIANTFEAHVARLFTKFEPFSIERTVHASLGVAGEAGEIVDAVKKTWVYGKPLDDVHVLEEAGDTLFYLVALLQSRGMTLRDAIVHNIFKLEKRYPQGYSDAAALARADKTDA